MSAFNKGVQNKSVMEGGANSDHAKPTADAVHSSTNSLEGTNESSREAVLSRPRIAIKVTEEERSIKAAKGEQKVPGGGMGGGSGGGGGGGLGGGGGMGGAGGSTEAATGGAGGHGIAGGHGLAGGPAGGGGMGGGGGGMGGGVGIDTQNR
jgi:hypothetical protein